MLKVGITGGIGSGKSVVCQVFRTLGIPIFNADDAARYLIDNDAALVAGIKSIFGDDIYTGGTLDRPRVASLAFSNRQLLEQLNAAVHPATANFARDWFERQQSPYVVKEAAIFFESGTHADMDVMVGVYAPREVRIQRAMFRGGLTRERVERIMASQMDEDEKMKRCDVVITNDDTEAVLPQVLKLHEQLLVRSATRS